MASSSSSLTTTTRDVVLLMVCVSSHDDCGRHCCVVHPATTSQEKCFVQPVCCWRCDRSSSGGLPPSGLVKPEEVESRFSTLLESVQLRYGPGLRYPAVYTASDFEAGGWAGETGLSQDDVVGRVEVGYPTAEMAEHAVPTTLRSWGALSSGGVFLPDGAPSEFIGPGSARDYLTWVRRGQEVDEWRKELSEYPFHPHSSRKGEKMLTGAAEQFDVVEESGFSEKLRNFNEAVAHLG
jgi:hypothetical protein